MDRDPWIKDYRRARQRRLALAEAAPAAPGHACCPRCGEKGLRVVERIEAAAGQLGVTVRRCQNCGNTTSKLEA